MESIRELLKAVPNYDALPPLLQDFMPMLVSCMIILGFVAVMRLFLTWLERKVSIAAIQQFAPFQRPTGTYKYDSTLFPPPIKVLLDPNE